MNRWGVRRRLILEAYPVFLLALLLQVWAPVASALMRAAAPGAQAMVLCLPSDSMAGMDDPEQAPLKGAADHCQICQFVSSPGTPMPEMVSLIRQDELRIAHQKWRVLTEPQDGDDPDPNIRVRAPPTLS